jgi:hypothetical protein
MKEIEKYNERKEREEQLEHRDVLLAIASILKSKEGRQLFKYLFKTLDVTGLPEPGMEAQSLHEYLGFLRAGNSIYKLVCEADSEIAANILSKISRENYDDLIEQYRLEHDHNYSTTEPSY